MSEIKNIDQLPDATTGDRAPSEAIKADNAQLLIGIVERFIDVNVWHNFPNSVSIAVNPDTGEMVAERLGDYDSDITPKLPELIIHFQNQNGSRHISWELEMAPLKGDIVKEEIYKVYVNHVIAQLMEAFSEKIKRKGENGFDLIDEL